MPSSNWLSCEVGDCCGTGVPEGGIPGIRRPTSTNAMSQWDAKTKYVYVILFVCAGKSIIDVKVYVWNLSSMLCSQLIHQQLLLNDINGLIIKSKYKSCYYCLNVSFDMTLLYFIYFFHSPLIGHICGCHYPIYCILSRIFSLFIMFKMEKKRMSKFQRP